MRTKKILSLAVVLAMVLTVMPMFGLTASAAEVANSDGGNASTLPQRGGTVVYGGVKYNVVSDNKLTNGDFSNGWTGWTTAASLGTFDSANNELKKQSNYSSKEGYSLLEDTNNNKYLHIDPSYRISNSDWKVQKGAYRSTQEGGADRRVLVPTKFWDGVEAGKMYYISFDIMVPKKSGSKNFTSFGAYKEHTVRNGEAEANGNKTSKRGRDFDGDEYTEDITPVATGTITPNLYTTEANKWYRVSSVLVTTADGYFGFQMEYACDWNSGVNLDNFAAYEITPVQKKVTIEYEGLDGTVYNSETVDVTVGEKFKAVPTVDDKSVIVTKTADSTEYLATFVSSEEITVSEDTENKVKVKVGARKAKLTKTTGIIKEGDFEGEDVKTYWKKMSGLTDMTKVEVSDYKAHNGEKSLLARVNDGGSSDGNFIGIFALNNDNVVDSGKKYLLSMWRHAPHGGITLSVGLHSGNTDGNIDISCGGLQNSNLENLPIEKWHRMGWELTAKEDSKYVKVYGRWAGGQYLDDIELYEVEDVAKDATGIVKYVCGNEEIKIDTTSDLYSGDIFAPTIMTGINGFYVDTNRNVVYKIGKPSKESVVLESGDNVITVNMIKYRTLSTTNLVTNPSFEEGLKDWFGGEEGTTPLGEVNIFSLNEDSSNVSDGSKSLKAGGTNGEAGTPLNTAWDVKENTEYYVSVDVKSTKGDVQYSHFYVANGDGSGRTAVGYDVSGEKLKVTKDQFVTKEFIISTGAGQTKLGFYGAWFANDAMPYFDNFKVYELPRITECEQTVTVNFTGADNAIESKTIKGTKGIEGYDLKYDFVRDSNNTLYYVNDDNAIGTYSDETTSLNLAVVKPGNVFSVTKAGKLLTDFLDDGKQYSGMSNFAAYNWGDSGTYDRVGVAILDVPESETGYYLTADWTRSYYTGDNKVNTSLWAIKPSEFEKMDVATVGGTWAADRVLVTGDLLPASNVLDTEVVKKNTEDGKIVIIGSSAKGLYGLSGDMRIVARPKAPTGTLGWSGENFTINFTGGEDTPAIQVYHENKDTGALEAMEPTTLEEGQNTVAVSTENTNRIYAAAVYDVVAGAMSDPASIYSLVVDAILADKGTGSIEENKLAAVNKVIANGGVYFDGELLEGTTLADKTKDIMSVTADNTVTINPDLVKLNIGFTYNEGKLYVGADTKAAEEAEGTYQALTIADGKVTLSGKIVDGAVSQAAEAITLSLDSVNIEFVETLIEELEGDGADSAVDFIPEL